MIYHYTGLCWGVSFRLDRLAGEDVTPRSIVRAISCLSTAFTTGLWFDTCLEGVWAVFHTS